MPKVLDLEGNFVVAQLLKLYISNEYLCTVFQGRKMHVSAYLYGHRFLTAFCACDTKVVNIYYTLN